MGMEQRRSSRDTCGKGVIMIRVNQLKLPIEHSEEMLRRQIIKTLHLKNEKDLIRYQIRKQSIDARRKTFLCIHSGCGSEAGRYDFT